MTTMMTLTRTATDGDATADALRLEALVSDLCARLPRAPLVAKGRVPLQPRRVHPIVALAVRFAPDGSV
jgi:hypothetical protein